MPKYVIERTIPGVGASTPDEIRAIAQASNKVLKDMPQVQWQHSYVTDDKIYCVYISPNEEAIREHARLGGFPADSITRVASVIDAVTGETVPQPVLN
jgi:hypothetical protein